MKWFFYVAFFISVITGSCNYVKYTPRTKTDKFRALPSIVLLDRIIDFRNEFGIWPSSKNQMIAKGKKYEEAWNGFQYLNYSFTIKSMDVLYFNFWDHTKDVENSKADNRAELNSYSGWVKFYKEGNIFVWKINKK